MNFVVQGLSFSVARLHPIAILPMNSVDCILKNELGANQGHTYIKPILDLERNKKLPYVYRVVHLYGIKHKKLIAKMKGHYAHAIAA